VARSASAPAQLLSEALAELDDLVQRLAADSSCNELVRVARRHSGGTAYGSEEEEDGEAPFEKPLTSLLRDKHDPASRRHGLHGRTGRCVNRRAFRAHFEDEGVQRVDEFHPPRSRWQRSSDTPTFVSALELAQGMQPSLDKGGGWDAVPALLEESALAPPARSRGSRPARGGRRSSDGAVVTEYRLAPLAMLQPEPHAAREAPEADPRLYRLHGRRVRRLAGCARSYVR